jgi:hypothetical protein
MKHFDCTKLQVGERNSMVCSTKNLLTMSVNPSLYTMFSGQHMPYQICPTKWELILTEFHVVRIFASQMHTWTRETCLSSHNSQSGAIDLITTTLWGVQKQQQHGLSLNRIISNNSHGLNHPLKAYRKQV